MENNQNERRSIGNMPYRRRHDGLSALEQREELRQWSFIISILMICLAAPLGLLRNALLEIALLLMDRAREFRNLIWQPHADQNQINRDREIESFTDEECWRLFRFKKIHLNQLFHLLNVPNRIKLVGGDKTGYVNGEYATLYMLFRLHYPGVLADTQVCWGRDYSSLSRVFNSAIDFHFEQHERKVAFNISWYSDRFNMYNESIQKKILDSEFNPNPGLIPGNLVNIFGFLDCTANKICRPNGHQNIQNAFYNGYHHGHFIIWQGVSFPDGMIVIEGPEPGFFTDTMVWRDSVTRQQLEFEMQLREAVGEIRLKLYADKIYNNSILITAAWSRRHGELQLWMVNENNLMSRVRVAVEWTFGKISGLYKFISFFKGQQLQKSTIAKQYTIACLLANCNTCLYGSQHNLSRSFDIEPPSLEDYLSQ